MTIQSTVTNQVNTAIANAHRNINGASQILPNDEQQLLQMSEDIQAKMKDLNNAQKQISSFLAKHRCQKPFYS